MQLPALQSEHGARLWTHTLMLHRLSMSRSGDHRYVVGVEIRMGSVSMGSLGGMVRGVLISSLM